MESDNRKIEELEQNLLSLQEENEILTERVEDIHLLGGLSQKVALCDEENEIVRIAVEEVSILKDISYCAYFKELDGSIQTMFDFGVNIKTSHKGVSFERTEELQKVLSEKTPLDKESYLPVILSLVPPMIDGAECNSFFLLPVTILKEVDGWMLFVNCGEDNTYLKRHFVLLSRVVEIVQTSVESIRLIEQLRQSESNYRTIFNGSSDAIFIHDAKTGEILDINSKVTEMYGYTRDEALEINIGKISSGIHPYTNEEAVRLVRKAYEENRPQIFEWQCKKKDGDRFWAEVTLKHISINGKSVILAVSRDITSRKEAEMMIRESEGKYRSLMNEMPLGIAYHRIVLDEEGHPVDYVFLETNDTFSALTGLPQNDIIGKRVTEALPGIEHDPTDWIGKYGKVALTGEAVHFDQHSEQLNRWFHVHAYSPKKNHFAVIFEDVTEIRQANEKIIQAKRQAEEATKLKDKFVSLVSHDLRSPFSSILGFMNLIYKDTKTELAPKHKEYLGKAIKSSKGLVKMINELLDISRLQTGKIVPEPRFIDGKAITSDVVLNLDYLSKEKGVEVENNIPIGTRLYADRKLFIQVMQNLVSNAIKFCGKGDKITLFVPENKETTVAVKDTGSGVEEHYLANLFKHEEKTTSKGTAGETGTGLGLPLSQEIMRAHGGALTVESALGVGSVFYATLPFVKPLLLIVDDDKISRRMFKTRMGMVDVEFIEAENGQQALEILENHNPHLVILDIVMPVMDGFETLSSIRDNPKTRGIPVIIVTSDNNQETREKAFQFGANDFVGKPYDLSELIPRVRRFIV